MINIKSVLLFLVLPATVANAQCILTTQASNLLTAEGLSKVWELSGGCSMANKTTQTYVEATIFDPSKGELYAYHPLVVDAGTTPAAPPVVPYIPDNSVIVYHFGSNAGTVMLKDTGNGALQNANCVNGLNADDLFGQFAYCNAPNFFNATKDLKNIPSAGNDLNGLPCPTTRSFVLVDQDQSDNVVTKYLLLNNGQTAQDTAANQKLFEGNFTVLSNPSDNSLLNGFVFPALGCKGFTIPSLDDPGTFTSTLASDELSAMANQRQPIALVPLTDPMTLSNGQPSLQKTNLYRLGAGQPQANNEDDASGTTYCQNLGDTGAPGIIQDFPLTIKGTTPDPATGNNLFTFLGARFNATWTILGCANLIGKPSPLIANLDGNGVAISVTFNGTTYPQKQHF